MRAHDVVSDSNNSGEPSAFYLCVSEAVVETKEVTLC
jgi:hypothetical protein